MKDMKTLIQKRSMVYLEYLDEVSQLRNTVETYERTLRRGIMLDIGIPEDEGFLDLVKALHQTVLHRGVKLKDETRQAHHLTYCHHVIQKITSMVGKDKPHIGKIEMIGTRLYINITGGVYTYDAQKKFKFRRNRKDSAKYDILRYIKDCFECSSYRPTINDDLGMLYDYLVRAYSDQDHYDEIYDLDYDMDFSTIRNYFGINQSSDEAQRYKDDIELLKEFSSDLRDKRYQLKRVYVLYDELIEYVHAMQQNHSYEKFTYETIRSALITDPSIIVDTINMGYKNITKDMLSILQTKYFCVSNALPYFVSVYRNSDMGEYVLCSNITVHEDF